MSLLPLPIPVAAQTTVALAAYCYNAGSENAWDCARTEGVAVPPGMACHPIQVPLGAGRDRAALGKVLPTEEVGEVAMPDGERVVFLGRFLGSMKAYPPTDQKDPIGRILVTGGSHGDESSSISVTFRWMAILGVHHSGLFHWHFVPVSNPDGLLRSALRRGNAHGVDLNRHFSSADWTELAQEYWESRTARDPRRNPGPGALSEPETRFPVDEIASFRPDTIISLHAPYGLVDHDGPPEAPRRIGPLTLRPPGVFPGSLGNYGGVDLEIPAAAVELAHAGTMPTPHQVSRMWTDLVAWLVRERRNRLASQWSTLTRPRAASRRPGAPVETDRQTA